MKSILNPYISFKGNAREAITFYQNALGGKIDMSTFGESGMPNSNPDGVMHAQLTCENGMNIMVSDVPDSMSYNPGDNVSISLSGENEEELKGYWEKLSVGATVVMPLDKAPWGDVFGMLKDQFGINWLVNISAKK